MTLDEIERAIALAKSRGLAELEVGIGQGGRLKVIVNRPQKPVASAVAALRPIKACLLYTSDDADDMQCVDVGGGGVI